MCCLQIQGFIRLSVTECGFVCQCAPIYRFFGGCFAYGDILGGWRLVHLEQKRLEKPSEKARKPRKKATKTYRKPAEQGPNN